MKINEDAEQFKKYVESGEYFTDVQKWYIDKYVTVFSHRSVFALLSFFIILIFAGIIMNLPRLLPITTSVRYAIIEEVSPTKIPKVIPANHDNNDSTLSIAYILLENYISEREKYSYKNLKTQFIYLKNNSTTIVFRRFYNFMDINNPSSPVVLYKDQITRDIKIVAINHLKAQEAKVKFFALTKNLTGEVLEQSTWEATINYEMNDLEQKLNPGSHFNFVVTDYQLKLLQQPQKSELK